ncbi:RING-H2 finger protein ATL78 [Trifolium repens]|jgi:E3 ubiquitin-protein ligase ATL10/75/76/77/78|nr:RING-H2 finger protein ATL78 [Trifolium repens]
MSLHQRLHRLLLDTNSASKTASGDLKFSRNLALISAALALIFVLGLNFNSIVRCIARLASNGFNKRALCKIPIVVYGSGSISSSFVGTDCPICLGEFIDGEKIRVLPKCNHGFHVECIDTWLLSHSSCPTCPICRQSLLEYPTASEASSVAVIVVAMPL